MATMYELEDSSAMKNQRLKSLRLIELSDHIIRLNRRENTQLEIRLRQLKRQETIIQRTYDREIYWKRLQLAQIYETLNESSDDYNNSNRFQTPFSFYSMKMRRNQSAPPNIRRSTFTSQPQSRPNTTSTPIRRNRRTMSIFKDMTLKPPYQTLPNMLLLLENEKKPYQNELPIRPKTTMNIKKLN